MARNLTGEFKKIIQSLGCDTEKSASKKADIESSSWRKSLLLLGNIQRDLLSLDIKTSSFKTYALYQIDIDQQIDDVIKSAEKALEEISSITMKITTYPSDQAKKHLSEIILFLESHVMQVEESVKRFAQNHYEKKKKIHAHSRNILLNSYSLSSKNTPVHEPKSNIASSSGWEIDQLEFENESDDPDLIDLDPNFRQELEKENEALLVQYQDTQKELETAMQSIHHLTSLQTIVNTKLQAQNEVIESIHDHAEKATKDITQGVTLIRKAEETMGSPKWWVLWIFLFLSGILLALDTWFS